VIMQQTHYKPTSDTPRCGFIVSTEKPQIHNRVRGL
jgi:hypothetical protein